MTLKHEIDCLNEAADAELGWSETSQSGYADELTDKDVDNIYHHMDIEIAKLISDAMDTITAIESWPSKHTDILQDMLCDCDIRLELAQWYDSARIEADKVLVSSFVSILEQNLSKKKEELAQWDTAIKTQTGK